MEQQRVGDTVRERSYAGIELLHSLVVADPGNIDPVLGPLQLVLQVEKILVGLQIGVAFHHHHEP